MERKQTGEMQMRFHIGDCVFTNNVPADMVGRVGTVVDFKTIDPGERARPGLRPLMPYQRIRVSFPDGGWVEGAAHHFELSQ